MRQDGVCLVNSLIGIGPADGVPRRERLVTAGNLEVILDLIFHGRAPHDVAHADLAIIEYIGFAGREEGANPLVQAGNRLLQVRGILPHVTGRKRIVVNNIQVAVAGGKTGEAKGRHEEIYNCLFHLYAAFRR